LFNSCLPQSSSESACGFSPLPFLIEQRNVTAHQPVFFRHLPGSVCFRAHSRPYRFLIDRRISHSKKGVLVSFTEFQLSPQILATAKAEGYTVATPIQAEAIPLVLAGKDVLGCAQTGTGKTAAFAMPILHRLGIKPPANGPDAHRPRCLVLCPTRELASQIADSFRTYGKGLRLRQAIIFGGVGQRPQVDSLRAGVDIIVATPGRLMDLMEQRHINLTGIEMLVLDEADRMLDMGFIQPIRKIVAKLPTNRQTLLFSATMPPEIRKLADSLLTNPSVVNVAPVISAVKVEESVYRVERGEKPALLAHLVQSLKMYRTIVFTRTKHGADRVVRHLQTRGIRAEAIHGNKSQNARQRALANFAANKIPILVATDIASRGIDVDGITHVVNYDLTHEPETYVHRIGRTARAGASGSAVSFCDREEAPNLRAIERFIRRTIPVVANPLPAGSAGSHEKPASRHSEDHDSQRSSHSSDRQSHRPRRDSGHEPARPRNTSPAAGGAIGRGVSHNGARQGHPHSPERHVSSSHSAAPARQHAAAHSEASARHNNAAHAAPARHNSVTRSSAPARHADGSHSPARPPAGFSPARPGASRPKHPIAGHNRPHSPGPRRPEQGRPRPTSAPSHAKHRRQQP
jgi:ATP-dependent RNA helicase RhlE